MKGLYRTEMSPETPTKHSNNKQNYDDIINYSLTLHSRNCINVWSKNDKNECKFMIHLFF